MANRRPPGRCTNTRHMTAPGVLEFPFVLGRGFDVAEIEVLVWQALTRASCAYPSLPALHDAESKNRRDRVRYCITSSHIRSSCSRDHVRRDNTSSHLCGTCSVDENVAPAPTVADAASVTTVTTRATVFTQPTAMVPIPPATVLPTTYGALTRTNREASTKSSKEVLGDSFEKTVLCDRIVDAPHVLMSFAIFGDIAVCRLARLLTRAN